MSEPALGATDCLLCGGGAAEPVVETKPHLAPDGGERFRFVRCAGCGLVYLNPRPAPEALERYYGPGYLPHRGPSAWGRWAPLVRRGLRRQDRARVREARQALAWAGGGREAGAPATADAEGHGPPGSGGPRSRGDGPPTRPRILDVGCGRPTFLRTAADRLGAECVGVDASDAGWREAPELADGLVLRVGEPGEAGLEGPCDLVTLWHALEHAFEPRPLLERLRGLTRPGGALLVEVPDHTSLPRRAQGPHWVGYDAPRHAAVYSPATLDRLLRETGWRDVEVWRHGTLDPWVLWWLGRQVRKGRSLEGSLEGDFLPFLAGKLLTWKVAALRRWIPLGVMTARARAPE